MINSTTSVLRWAENSSCMITHFIVAKVDRLIKDFVTGGIKAYKKPIFCKYLGYVVEIMHGAANS